MVKRVVILNDASTARGGATGLALQSMRALVSRSIPVTFITGDDGLNDELQAIGVDVVALGHQHLLKKSKIAAVLEGIRNPSASKLVGEWIAKNDDQETVYHVHGWSKVLSPSIFTALKGVAPRTFIHAHDFFLACPNGGFMDYQRDTACSRQAMSFSCIATHCDKRSYAQKIWRVTRQKSLSSALGDPSDWAAIVMIHERMRRFFVSYGYPDGVLKTVRNPASAFTIDRIPAEKNEAFFFVGRLEPEKGIEDIISAAELAGVPLEIIGDGPLKQTLEAAHPQLLFHGWRDRVEIGQLLRRARALVMASRYPEPFGLVAAEASMSGLPVVLSDTAFLAGEVVGAGIGFAVQPMRPDQLARVITHVSQIAEPDIRDMSERAYLGKTALAQSPDEWIEHLLDLYSNAIAHNAK
jgi:glycosyltransferase involved in cell wall biosynthesis